MDSSHFFKLLQDQPGIMRGKTISTAEELGADCIRIEWDLQWRQPELSLDMRAVVLQGRQLAGLTLEMSVGLTSMANSSK